MFNWILLAFKLQLTSTLTGVFRSKEKLQKVDEDHKLFNKNPNADYEAMKIDYEKSKTKRMVLIHGDGKYVDHYIHISDLLFGQCVDSSIFYGCRMGSLCRWITCNHRIHSFALCVRNILLSQPSTMEKYRISPGTGLQHCSYDLVHCCHFCIKVHCTCHFHWFKCIFSY